MKTRRLKKVNDNYNIVWFGVYGTYIDEKGKTRSLFYNATNKHDNYGTENNHVADGLIQRLSVLKYELWYRLSFGMPTIDKVRDKAFIDAYVARVVLSHKDVLSIDEFESSQSKTTYSCKMKISTVYGSVKISL